MKQGVVNCFLVLQALSHGVQRLRQRRSVKNSQVGISKIELNALSKGDREPPPILFFEEKNNRLYGGGEGVFFQSSLVANSEVVSRRRRERVSMSSAAQGSRVLICFSNSSEVMK